MYGKDVCVIGLIQRRLALGVWVQSVSGTLNPRVTLSYAFRQKRYQVLSCCIVRYRCLVCQAQEAYMLHHFVLPLGYKGPQRPLYSTDVLLMFLSSNTLNNRQKSDV